MSKVFTHPLERWQHRFNIDGYLFGEQPNAYLALDARHGFVCGRW